jgi:2,4,7-trihydroxy-1,4-benzoxazin-3-one-glucoside 7-O-methyltransferase
MERCKEAISGKDGKGKVIIIDTVIGSKPNDDAITCKETQVLFDLYMMSSTNGEEREEHEWRRIFLAAGFRD